MTVKPSVEQPSSATDQDKPLLPLLLFIFVLMAFAASRLAVINVPFEREFDEGVYLLSARSVAAGHGLFSAVFSSQPPAFIESLALAMRLFGDSLMTGRLYVLGFALVALAAVAFIAGDLAASIRGRAAGRWAALTAAAALAIGITFGDLAHVVQAELPALSVALVSLCLCLHARHRKWHRGWLIAAGAVLATAAMFKLIAMPYAAPLGLLLLLAPADNDAPWQIDGKGAALAGRVAARSCYVALGAALIAGLPLLVYDWQDLYDQNVAFHIAKHDAYIHDPLLNLMRCANQVSDDPTIAAGAVVGLLVLMVRSRLGAGWLIVWILAGVAAIVEQTPLFWRHFVLVTPPLAVACGLLPILTWRVTRRSGVLFASLAMIGIMMAPALRGSGHRGALRSWNAVQQRRELMTESLQASAQWIHDHTDPEDVVVGDDPIVIYLSGRQSPPDLCDTSQARIIAGALRLRQAIQATDGAPVVVLHNNGRLSHLAGYRDWLRQNYNLQRDFDTGPIGSRTMWKRKADG